MEAAPIAPAHGQTAFSAISADGQTIVGFASSATSNGDPLVYQEGGFTVLDKDGATTSAAYAISPNGNIIGGHIDGQGAVWRKGTNWQDSLPLRLSINSNPVGRVLGVSDTGFAVGTTAGGGYVHDPRTGLTSWFDEWWQNETGSAVPHHVTGVNDVYEAGGQLYFALVTTNGAAPASVNAPPPPAPSLSIASLPSGQIELRWPTNQSGIVESTPGLIPSAWLPLTNPMPTQSNGQFVLTLSPTNAATFFRLQFSSP